MLEYKIIDADQFVQFIEHVRDHQSMVDSELVMVFEDLDGLEHLENGRDKRVHIDHLRELVNTKQMLLDDLETIGTVETYKEPINCVVFQYKFHTTCSGLCGFVTSDGGYIHAHGKLLQCDENELCERFEQAVRYSLESLGIHYTQKIRR